MGKRGRKPPDDGLTAERRAQLKRQAKNREATRIRKEKKQKAKAKKLEKEKQLALVLKEQRAIERKAKAVIEARREAISEKVEIIPTKVFNVAEQVKIQIDSKTAIYVNKNADIKAIKAKYGVKSPVVKREYKQEKPARKKRVGQPQHIIDRIVNLKVAQMKELIHFCETSTNPYKIDQAKIKLRKLSGL